ncbi:hybrid sensor histidine kinase/response regulator [Phormidesmis priestleyi ULC007]|uniref:histidine kinase n=1 Tax=Phormidesmis priestleyi ULC007 TaxID=1920490 RepID=A0A2T1DLC9_9CYAN|nr:hybrid sensor histidine kinase/response regulator [Phormidesmis priestleyi]PSB21282.1 hybrid sensor histidine kinase/response regulator [Phormidesmis priestleyi ULC007]PZO50653.1 MAG: hybrid sensor histidine kinase/response regulator [Phormidesmis priestleyi]
MSHAKELEIRRQFLDEAQEYLDALDAALIGLADNRVDTQKINAALRAIHSIKGGAGMMGFTVLSDLAHRLEDSFKVLKVEKAIAVDFQLETLLLTAVDVLRRVIEYDRHNAAIDPQWLNIEVDPLFEQLHKQLGDPQDENAASVLSPEDGQDIVPLLFETEVEGCLQRLEGVLATPDQPCLQEELTILAQELGGLGEMLQLPAFVRLCASVTYSLEVDVSNVSAIAESALQSWRRTQALVMIGQYDQIPEAIALAPEIVIGENQDLTSFNLAAEDEFSWQDAATVEQDSFGESDESESIPDWYVAALETDSVAVDDAGYTEFQPAARSLIGESQVSDFKVLDGLADGDIAPPEEDLDTTVRVPVRQLNQLNDLFGELTIDRNGLDLYIKRLRNLNQQLHDRVKALDHVNEKMRDVYDKSVFDSDLSISLSGLRLLAGTSSNENANNSKQALKSKTQNLKSDFDSLELDRYNDLHLLSQQVMETIVQIQEVSQDIELSLDDTEQTTRSLNKTAKQLQSGLSQLRMRPLSDIVDRFPRALRELSLQHGKQVTLKVAGNNTLIDRNILETLNDPLMHLLRNAFDHGIENAETRQARGKSAEGSIEIRATHQGSRTIITVRDDGEGIAIEKIRDRAEQMGLDPTLLASASDEELLSLIFEPGFSTSDRVTTLSGRGVGMDVVRNNLKQIRGEIKVNTQPGLGTTFTLSVPFTLSTVRVLLAESNGMLLAFPTEVIEEMSLLKPEQILQTAGSEMLNWHGQILQFVRLQRWLSFNCPRQPHGFETPPTITSTSVIIANHGSQRVGLQIDRCWGEQEATIRRINGTLPLPPGFSSCTILGNGRVVPLVSLSELLRWITSYERTEPPMPSLPSLESTPTSFLSAAMGNQPATILVVDDSINVRRFLALTLERAGYRVEQAKDGQDALDRLENGSSVQAVVCDIEMPRLDGYGLLAKLRANPDLERLPVTMLSSRSSEKHRQLAMNLGANAYFSKPYNEQVLLRTLEQLVTPAAV